jgi:hypothetical protein
MALDGIAAHPLAQDESVGAILRTTTATDIQAALSLSTATYLTGTKGAATARAVAIGPDGSTYEAGTITENGSEVAYAAKYDLTGTRVFLDPVQIVDSNQNALNTEGTAVAIDGLGNVYLGGTDIDTTAVPHSYGLKISADGSSIVWLRGFVGPSNTTGLAVSDPNGDGTGSVAWTGTFTILDPAVGPVGDHVLAVHFNAGGTRDYAFYYTFQGNAPSQGKAIAFNSASTASNPGSLLFLAGNIVLNGNQQALADQLNGANGNGIWANTITNTSTTDTLTSVAVNPDDSSVFAGTVATTGNVGLVVGYAADGSSLVLPTVVRNATTLNAVTVDAAGNIYVAGAATDPTQGGVYVAMLDSAANVLSETQFGGTTAADAGYGIVVTSSGSLWVVGDTTSTGLSTDGSTLNGTQDGFLASVTP